MKGMSAAALGSAEESGAAAGILRGLSVGEFSLAIDHASAAEFFGELREPSASAAEALHFRPCIWLDTPVSVSTGFAQCAGATRHLVAYGPAHGYCDKA